MKCSDLQNDSGQEKSGNFAAEGTIPLQLSELWLNLADHELDINCQRIEGWPNSFMTFVDGCIVAFIALS